MVFTRKDGDFPWRFVSLVEGTDFDKLNHLKTLPKNPGVLAISIHQPKIFEKSFEVRQLIRTEGKKGSPLT